MSKISKEHLDEYLVSFFDFLSLNDAKEMAVLKALEYFSGFLHQKGIFTDEELKEVEGAIEEFNVPLREIYIVCDDTLIKIGAQRPPTLGRTSA